MTGSIMAIALLAGLVMLGLSHVTGAWMSRKHIQRLHEIADAVLVHPDATFADRAWMKTAMLAATGRADLWIASAFAPFVLLYTVWDSIVTIWTKQSSEDIAEQLEKSNHDLVQEQTNVDPSKGALWKTDLREEAFDEALAAVVLSKPLAAAWLAIWILPALIILLLAGAGKTVKPFIEETVLGLGRSTMRYSHK